MAPRECADASKIFVDSFGMPVHSLDGSLSGLFEIVATLHNSGANWLEGKIGAIVGPLSIVTSHEALDIHSLRLESASYEYSSNRTRATLSLRVTKPHPQAISEDNPPSAFVNGKIVVLEDWELWSQAIGIGGIVKLDKTPELTSLNVGERISIAIDNPIGHEFPGRQLIPRR